jgi:hypothetical protein
MSLASSIVTMCRLAVALLLSSLAALAFPAFSTTESRRAATADASDPYKVQTVCTAYPVNIGRRVAVSNGAELQQALDTASGGDTIMLTPNATFVPSAPEGSFMLRNRHLAPGQWVIVRSASAAFDSGGAVARGTRVSDANAILMPQLRATRANAPAIRAEPAARGYRLVGLDIGADSSVQQLTNLVELGAGADVTVDTEPSDIIIDRSYLHGSDTGNFRRGVLMNGAALAVIDSYLANFHDANGDSQALGGSNGPGPFRIVNNFLEAASENILFGGADPAVPNLVPSDIEVRRNLSTKRLSWQTSNVAVKNAFELKNARRVVVEGNTFEHVWVSGQDGTAILLKSVNQDGNCAWCVTEYVTFRDNIVRGAAHGVVVNATETGRKGLPLPVPANHLRFENVLFDDLGGPQWGGGGKLLRIFGGVADLSFTHVTSRGNITGVLDPASTTDANPRLVFSYNIAESNRFGIGAGADEGVKTLSRNFAPFTYRQNVLVNTSADGGGQTISDDALQARYPPTTWVAHGWNDVGFEQGTSKLAKASRYAHAGEDGKDIGADTDAIAVAQSSSARAGDGCGPQAIPRPRKGR